MKVLITGLAAFIESHIQRSLVAAGHGVVGLDNLCDSFPGVAERVAHITSITPGFI